MVGLPMVDIFVYGKCQDCDLPLPVKIPARWFGNPDPRGSKRRAASPHWTSGILQIGWWFFDREALPKLTPRQVASLTEGRRAGKTRGVNSWEPLSAKLQDGGFSD